MSTVSPLAVTLGAVLSVRAAPLQTAGTRLLMLATSGTLLTVTVTYLLSVAIQAALLLSVAITLYVYVPAAEIVAFSLSALSPSAGVHEYEGTPCMLDVDAVSSFVVPAHIV